MGILFFDRRLFDDDDGSIVHESPASGFFRVLFFALLFSSFLFFLVLFKLPSHFVILFIFFFPLVRIKICIGNWLSFAFLIKYKGMKG